MRPKSSKPKLPAKASAERVVKDIRRAARKVKEGKITADLNGFMTGDPNPEVKAVHPKAMPVILTEADEIDV